MIDDKAPRAARRGPSLTIAAWAAALALLWLAMLTVGTGPVDGHILTAIYAGDSPLWESAAQAATFFGEWWLVVAISVAAGVAMFFIRGWHHAVALLAVTLVGRLLVTAQKYAVLRLRPDIQDHLVPVSTPSFPSGHTAGATIVYLTLALVLTSGTRWKWPAVTAALVLSFAIGISRVVLGVHWPTDVIGGWAFGLLWVTLAIPWAERLVGPKR